MSKPVNKKPKESPIERAVGIRKTALGWVAVEYMIRDNQVVEEKASEPDLRSLTLEKFRRLIHKSWNEDII